MPLTIYPNTDYDSFVSIEDATTTISNYTLSYSSWDELTDADKEVYLRVAFRTIIDGLESIPSEFPTCITQAQSLIAVQDLSVGISTNSTSTTGAVKKEKASVVEIEYYEPIVNSTGKTVVIPKLAIPCLESIGWLGNYSIGGFNQVRLGRS